MSQHHFSPILACVAAATLSVVPVQAADDNGTDVVNVTMRSRADYQHRWIGDEDKHSDDGFKGSSIVLNVTGRINDHFSYSFQHQLKYNSSEPKYDFLKNTQWAHVDYSPNEHLTFSGGKHVVAVGGYEYDRSPTDIFNYSEGTGSIACYQLGASAAWRPAQEQELTLQVTQSPFREKWENADMYAYNLLWTGKFGAFSTRWSANMMEWKQGEFISTIALGNQLMMGNKARLQFDLTNRATSHHRFLFKDWSVITELRTMPSRKLELAAKYTYDEKSTTSPADMLVLAGTKVHSLGASVEYFPLKNHDLRLHAAYRYGWGDQSKSSAVIFDRDHMLSVGLTWKLHIYSRH